MKLLVISYVLTLFSYKNGAVWDEMEFLKWIKQIVWIYDMLYESEGKSPQILVKLYHINGGAV